MQIKSCSSFFLLKLTNGRPAQNDMLARDVRWPLFKLKVGQSLVVNFSEYLPKDIRTLRHTVAYANKTYMAKFEMLKTTTHLEVCRVK